MLKPNGQSAHSSLHFVWQVPWYLYAAFAIVVTITVTFSGFFEPLSRILDTTTARHSNWGPIAALVFSEAVFYLVVAGALQAAAVGIFAIVVLALVPWRGAGTSVRTVGAFLELNVTLLLYGAAGNVVWVAVARDKLYVPCDPVVEWFAFLPYTSAAYDCTWGTFRGHLINGASDTQLAMVWGAIALAVWIATWITLRVLHQRNRRSSSVAASSPA